MSRYLYHCPRTPDMGATVRTSRTRVYETILADSRRNKATSNLLLCAAAVDRLADNVSVTSVPSGLLNHVYRNPPRVPRHLSPCARRVEINRSEDLPRGGDLFPVVR